MATTTASASKVAVCCLDSKVSVSHDREDSRADDQTYSCVCTLALQHGDDVVGGAVAEELSEGLFVVADSMSLDHGDDVCGCEAGEGGFGEVRIFGEKIFGAGVDVGEVASAASGDQDLLADAFGVVEQDNPAATAAGLDCAHHAGGARSQNYDINLLHSHSPLRLSRFMMARSLVPGGCATMD